jgi:hypothetical protein
MNPLKKNQMQRKKNSLGNSRKELENTKVRSLSSALIVLE